MKGKTKGETRQPGQGLSPTAMIWLTAGSWGITIMIVAYLAFLMLSRGAMKEVLAQPMPETQATVEVLAPEINLPAAGLPDYILAPDHFESVSRTTNPHTILLNRSRTGLVEYTVQKGDSVFSIATKYKLKPETVLWANYDQLDDNPNMLSVGQTLKIPPTDGVYYEWKDGDTLDGVASQFFVSASDILSWPQNNLDMTNPKIDTGTFVMIPGGWRENRQWVIPTVWKPNAGASKTIDGPGGCELSGGGIGGSGAFIWPTINNYLSGNDYWSGHLGIDIAAPETAPVYAADSGVVVYAGWIGGGYGNMIMIDHGNGYHTLYAHLNSINVGCGQSVYQGAVIGLAGSTGNSTGPHLHFEVRLNGGFVNPWYVLP